MAASNSDSSASPRPLRLAIEGCGHGTLHSIYASIEASCRIKQWPSIDLLIIGGDFQSVRNPRDLNCMSVPVKYRELGDFYEYYSGKRTAPYLTIFVGGNHEASNYLHELYYGGWVAPNIYYLGAANVLSIGGIRIAGLSGIWKGFDYRKPHFERMPYNQDDVKSAYHVRELDVRKLLQLRTHVDIGLSHDWPKGIEWMGDHAWLFRKKDHFRDDANTGRLGSLAAKHVLDRLRPVWWFSAHLHIKYTAVIQHQVHKVASQAATADTSAIPAAAKNTDEIDLDLDDGSPADQSNETGFPKSNQDEIDLDLDDVSEDKPDSTNAASNGDINSIDSSKKPVNDVSADLRAQLPAAFAKPVTPSALPFPSSITNTKTSFLALDKCLPNRDFLQLMEIPRPRPSADETAPLRLEYDPEWLAITRALHVAHSSPPYVTLGEPSARCPPDLGDAHYLPLIEEAQQWIEKQLAMPGSFTVPLNFEQIAPSYDPTVDGDWRLERDQPREFANPQTQAFCDMLQIENPFAISEEQALANLQQGPKENDSMNRGGFNGRGWRGRGQSDRGHRGRGRGRGGFDHGRGRGRGRGGRW